MLSAIRPVEIVIPVYSYSITISKNTLIYHLDKFPDHLQLYTDASKQSNGVGCAFFIPTTNVCAQYRLNENTSIFSAESIAIFKAIEYTEGTP
ncbi:hypothetical protein JTB14_005500 [Gonioctena quinquepunctata]|nr:hypothetical protein JTB14_005500 [Gonioctena quinquepunctata]